MARRKKLSIFETRMEILTALAARGYSPQRLRKEGPSPNDDVAMLLFRAYQCLGQQEELLTDLGIRLTLAEAGHKAGDTFPKERKSK